MIFFVSLKNKFIKLEVLATKMDNSDILISDIQRLIESSNCWLSNYRGWVRLKTR